MPTGRCHVRVSSSVIEAFQHDHEYEAILGERRGNRRERHLCSRGRRWVSHTRVWCCPCIGL